MKNKIGLLLILLCACGGKVNHGRFSALTANLGQSNTLCEHRVPSSACTRCEPSREAAFKKVNDWCAPHKVPESQCFPCHPDLSFEPLPQAPKGADVKSVPPDLALKGLEGIIAKEKMTVIDFWAIWCVPCHQTAGQLNLLLTQHHDLAVRKIEVKDWEDPLVEKYMKGVAKLPLLIVFNGQGKEVGRVSGHRPEELAKLLHQAE